MAVPTIIIELFENKFEGLFSNTEIKFLIVNRDRDDDDKVDEDDEELEPQEDDEDFENAQQEEDEMQIFGPYSPTLETNRLAEAVGWIKIPESRLNAPPEGPFLCSPVPDYSFD